jgi:hypothetical protein
MDSAKQQLADKLKSANNILVTVSSNPSVDQLAALLGLTLLLNKAGKHSVAVFSGAVPSTIEFLKPDETIEKNTDSLRDFIIALDKNKADKLRYKVEDSVVRIFITPYKTSISQADLDFSQGDFNVDVVVALGVKQQQDLDGAITAHGRILHDATLASVNLGPDGGLGTVNWHDPQASSLSELITELVPLVGENLLDNQIATALLTGIVAETDRFSNDKTTSQTMTASSALMAAGANQQLVATKLEEPLKKPESPSGDKPQEGGEAPKSDNGTLSIEHDKSAEAPDKEGDKPAGEQGAKSPEPPTELPAPQATSEEAKPAEDNLPAGKHLTGGPSIVSEPPKLGGTLSANTQPEGLDPVTDPLSMPQAEQPRLLDHSNEASTPPPTEPQPTPPAEPPAPPIEAPAPPPEPSTQPQPGQSIAPSAPAPSQPEPPMPSATPLPPAPASNQTLIEIEQAVKSPHVDPQHLDSARDEVNQALNSGPDTATPAPIAALNAQPLGEDLRPPAQPPLPTVTPTNEPVLPLGPPPPSSADTNPQVTNPNAPPEVPPPFPVQFGNAPSPTSNSPNPPL